MNDMRTILMIDDDAELAPPLAQYFERFDLHLLSALRPSEGLEKLRAEPIDAVILDVMMPEMDGFETCKAIRQFSDVPIIMLTARGDVMDRVVGLEIGADDYLAKPFEARELVARLGSLLRRQRQGDKTELQQIELHGLSIDRAKRVVLVHGEEVELTSSEFELLWALAQVPSEVLSRDDLLEVLRGQQADIYTRAIDISISRLRKKLEPLDAIKTVRNVGYCLALAKV